LQEKPRPRSGLFEDSSDDDSENGKVKPEKSTVLPSSSQKDKQSVSNEESKKPSQHTVATWRRGDDDMEPSAKMLALIEQLQIAENAGDKTIVYSQCPSSPIFFHSVFFSSANDDDAHMDLNRDVNAEFSRDGVGAVWYPVFAVRWEDAERGTRSSTHRVPQDRRAQSHPHQHQMRRRRVKPHLCQPSGQVSTPASMLPFLFLSARDSFVLNEIYLC
jgi:hypothetical protein